MLWVAGDFHLLASTGRVSPSGVGSRAIEVLAGPGAQVANPLGVGRAMPFASSCIRPCRVDLGLPHPNCVGGNRQVRIPVQVAANSGVTPIFGGLTLIVMGD